MKVQSSYRPRPLLVITVLALVAVPSSGCWWDRNHTDPQEVSLDSWETVEEDAIAVIVEDVECMEFDDVNVDETDDEIVITASMYRLENGCDDLPVEHHETVDLDQPVGDRDIIDGSTR